MDSDDIHFENVSVSGRPIMVGDIKEMFQQIDDAYNYLRTLPEDAWNAITPALNIAIDSACNLCYELGFESPEEVDGTPYYIFRLDPSDW